MSSNTRRPRFGRTRKVIVAAAAITLLALYISHHRAEVQLIIETITESLPTIGASSAVPVTEQSREAVPAHFTG